MDVFAFVPDGLRSSSRLFRGDRPATTSAVAPIDSILERLSQETKENRDGSGGLLPELRWRNGEPPKKLLQLSCAGFGSEDEFNLEDDFLDILPIEKKRQGSTWDDSEWRTSQRPKKGGVGGQAAVTAFKIPGTLPPIRARTVPSTERRPLTSVSFAEIGESAADSSNADNLNAPLHDLIEYKGGRRGGMIQRSNHQTEDTCSGKAGAGAGATDKALPRPLTALGVEDARVIFVTAPKMDEFRRRRKSSRRRKQQRPDTGQKALLSNKWSVGAVPLVLPPTDDQMADAFRSRDERLEVTRHRRRDAESDQRHRLLSSIERKDLDRVQTKTAKARRAREMEALRVVTLVATVVPWMEDVVAPAIENFRYQKELYAAATRIQAIWRREYFARKVLEARDVNYKLNKIAWRLLLWGRSTRRRVNAILLRQFFHDFAYQQLNYIMHTFRYRVMSAQRLVRNFIDCKRARIHALEKCWVELEREVVYGDNGTRNGTRKRRKNALIAQRIVPQKKASKWSKIQLLASTVSGTTGKADDGGGFNLVKTICRYHLEDERKMHRARSAGKAEDRSGGDSSPLVTQNHARLLLSGESVSVDLLWGRKTRPHFRLLSDGGKRRIRQVMEVLVENEEAVKAHMETRLQKENVAMMSNRYAAGIAEADDENDDEGDLAVSAAASIGNRRIAMVVSRVDRENRALAQKHRISEHEVQELREIFQLVDLDGGGTIDGEEMGKLLDLLGMQKAEDEIDDIMSAISETGTGEVNFTDFVRSLKENRPARTYSEEVVLAAFKSFAKGMPDGKIRNDQLFKALLSYKGKWSPTAARAAMCDAGLDGSVIDYHQFVTIMSAL